MITADHHLHAIDAFDERVVLVAEADWRRGVPSCPGWDVRALVTHVAEVTLTAGLLLKGDDPDRAADRVGRLVSVDDPFASWRRAGAYTRSVLDQVWLAGEVQAPSGPMHAADLVAEVCCDTVIHTWDLAVAIDADPLLDHVLVAACADWFPGVEEQWRARGSIGPRATAGVPAEAQDDLLARFGRSVGPDRATL